MGMGVDTGGGLDHRGRRGRQRSRPMAEINVTPFVDVMLVLLIVFMVTAPLMTVGVEVELPKTEAGQVEGSKEPLVISVDAKGDIFLQETKISMEKIVPKLLAVSKAGFKERIYIRGDNSVIFGKISRVMGHLSSAGYQRITVITETLDEN
jgi:biopolymer transport protein TolR